MRQVMVISICALLAACNTEVVGTEEGNDQKRFEEVDTGKVAIDTGGVIEEPLLTDTLSETDSIMSLRYIELDNGLTLDKRKKGAGARVAPGDVCLINYTLYNKDLKKLDSNEKLGFPLGVLQGLGMVPEGLDSALAYMESGDKARIKVPYELGFTKMNNEMVKTGDDIIYDVDLVEVVTPLELEGGVRVYKVFDGNGTPVETGDQIGIDYFAYHSTGKMFDTSRKLEGSFEFHVGQGRVMDGLDQGLLSLRVGDKAFLKIPAEHAYGSKGLQDLVPPNMDLIYLVTIDYKK